MHAERAIRGAWIHGPINPRGGRGESLPQHLAPVILVPSASDPELRSLLRLRLALTSSPRILSPIRMAPPHSITVTDPLPWPRSTATRLVLSELVTAGQLAANEDGRPPAWIDPPVRDREPNLPFGYVVSFIRFHERGFAAPASRFLRGIPGDPSELGSLGPPLPRGAAHRHHAGAEGAPRDARPAA
jgi:hypothetical protein